MNDESTPRSKGRRGRGHPPDLSSRRIIKDSKKPKELEDIYFNAGMMPENSWRCMDCKAGFTLTYNRPIKLCPYCGSDDLIEYHKAKLADQVDDIKREREENEENQRLASDSIQSVSRPKNSRGKGKKVS